MSKNYRAPWHDYKSRCSYHITLIKNPEMPLFGRLAGDFRLPVGSPGSPYIKASTLGQAVKAALREISSIHPALRVYQYALMPDHLHILLGVESALDEILGRKIAMFKIAVNNKTNCNGIFAPGFHDAILNPSREFSTVIKYLRSNPYRLAVRRAYPDYFQRVNRIELDGKPYQAYGNLHLLDNPFKEQVVIHRADSHDELARKTERWLYTAANGGVLVSPFISKAEKEVRTEAEAAGARIILITHEAFPERFKPSAHEFALCEQGRLLIISLGLPPKTELTRAHCLSMNSIAKSLVG